MPAYLPALVVAAALFVMAVICDLAAYRGDEPRPRNADTDDPAVR
ncbi:hypothetical protein ACQPW1_30365 [Nocardia sp. CA-128927]